MPWLGSGRQFQKICLLRIVRWNFSLQPIHPKCPHYWFDTAMLEPSVATGRGVKGSAQMRAGCEECQRLWREYALATSEHIRSDNKLRLASLEHDYEAIEQLTPGTDTAEKNRSDLRAAIAAHENAAHATRGQL